MLRTCNDPYKHQVLAFVLKALHKLNAKRRSSYVTEIVVLSESSI